MVAQGEMIIRPPTFQGLLGVLMCPVHFVSSNNEKKYKYDVDQPVQTLKMFLDRTTAPHTQMKQKNLDKTLGG